MIDMKRFFKSKIARDKIYKKEKDIIMLKILASELISFSKNKEMLVDKFIELLIPIYRNTFNVEFTFDEMKEEFFFIATQHKIGDNHLRALRVLGNL